MKRANTMSTITVDFTIKVKNKFTSSNAEKTKWIHLTTDVKFSQHQLSCVLDSCTISASYEVSQAHKALLLLPRTEKGSSTSSEEHCANPPDPTHEDVLQEH